MFLNRYSELCGTTFKGFPGYWTRIEAIIQGDTNHFDQFGQDVKFEELICEFDQKWYPIHRYSRFKTILSDSEFINEVRQIVEA